MPKPTTAVGAMSLNHNELTCSFAESLSYSNNYLYIVISLCYFDTIGNIFNEYPMRSFWEGLACFYSISIDNWLQNNTILIRICF